MTDLQGERRATYVQDMFGRIAGRYDLMNRLMTFGQDKHWRRFVVAQARVPAGGRLLDLAAGTGDIACLARQADSTLAAFGTDFALPMMQVGRRRPDGEDVRWCQGDALALPYPDNSFDAVVSGYLLRNLVNLPRGLAEQVRVVRPGGRVVALDTTPPRGIMRPFILLYLRVVIPLLGRLVAGAPDAYEYLPSSTQSFKTPEELLGLMSSAGLTEVSFRTFMFGTMAVHWGEKPVGYSSGGKRRCPANRPGL